MLENDYRRMETAAPRASVSDAGCSMLICGINGDIIGSLRAVDVIDQATVIVLEVWKAAVLL